MSEMMSEKDFNDGPLTPNEQRVWREEVSAVKKRLSGLQDMFGMFSDSDWRSSLAWEVIQEVKEKFDQDMWDVAIMPHKPTDFVHWREKYPHWGKDDAPM